MIECFERLADVSPRMSIVREAKTKNAFSRKAKPKQAQFLSVKCLLFSLAKKVLNGEAVKHTLQIVRRFTIFCREKAES